MLPEIGEKMKELCKEAPKTTGVRGELVAWLLWGEVNVERGALPLLAAVQPGPSKPARPGAPSFVAPCSLYS